jgi:hypothetical protein
MNVGDAEVPPSRGTKHEALAAFLGRWRAEGLTYGGPKQSKDNPKGATDTWRSTHTGKWHTGSFFLIQDERALIGADQQTFDTLTVMGVDSQTGQYFARSFENHGFYRHYVVSKNDNVWTLDGEHERARIAFSDDGNTQTITWEWKPRGEWLPLCDRVAVRDG